MRNIGRSLALGIVSVALAVVGCFATPAVADSSQAAAVTANGTAVAADSSGIGQVTIHKRGDGTKAPAELGNPSEWGVVKIKMDASSDTMSPMSEACVTASGGDWCYGWYATNNGLNKYCYSNYYHNTKVHKSTVNLANHTVTSGWVSAGDTSNAHYTAGLIYTCSTYYSIQ